MKLVKAEYPSVTEQGKAGFEDFDCYRLALDVMVNAHQIAVALPAEEKYDLVQQLHRAAKSVPANIAEGYGRFHYLDSLRFYSIARGSLNETINHFITAQLLGYIDEMYYKDVYSLARQTEKALNGFMNYIRRQKVGSDLYGNKVIKEDNHDYDINPTDQE